MSIDLTPNCVAQWHLNEAAANVNVLDATDNNVDGIASANTDLLTVAGKLNTAFYLQRVWASYIDFGNNLNFEWSDSFSIASWLNHSNDIIGIVWGASAITKSRRGSGGEDIYPGWGLYGMVTGIDLFATFILSNNEMWSVQVEARDTPIDDSFNWHLVIVTYNGNGLASGVKIYIDNVLQTLTTVQDNLGERTTINAYSLNVGAINNQTAVWDGHIDETCIFNKELSAAEANLLWNNGYGTELLKGGAFTSCKVIGTPELSIGKVIEEAPLSCEIISRPLISMEVEAYG